MFFSNIICINCVLAFTQALCPDGWFGTDCQYQCHCVVDCSETGTCIGGSFCRKGWFGHKCQYQDLAAEALVTTSGNQALNWLTDNNDISCNSDPLLNTVKLKWNSPVPITWLRLTFKALDMGSGLSIDMINFNYTCSRSSFSRVDNFTVDIGCGLPVASASEIIVSGPDVRELCSFYTSGGFNTALKKRAVGTVSASNVVDGSQDTCTVLPVSDNWTLQLNKSHRIYRTCIYFSGNNQTSKTFRISFMDQRNNNLYPYSATVNSLTYCLMYLGNESVYEITITSDLKLTICEVEVFTECSAGFWEVGCQTECNSNCRTKSCNSQTGICDDGCKTGYQRPDCLHVCGIGYFGIDCSQKCQDYCDGNIHCDKVNGGCLNLNASTTTISPLSLTEDQKTSDSTGIIAGCIVGGAVVVLIVVVSLVFVRKRRKTKRKQEGSNANIRMKAIRNGSGKVQDLKSRGYRKVKRLQSTSIDVDQLGSYLKKHGEDNLRQEFKKDPKPVNVTTEAGQRIENQPKNNFPDILPYDKSRVHLTINTGKNQSDYINASYIRRINNTIQFIASQSPNENTVDDFVRMIMEQKIKTIVMLNDLQELKCKKYWPENGCLCFGTVQIMLLSEDVFYDYVVRKFELNSKVEQKSLLVSQFQYTSWTSKNLPWTACSFVEFQQKIASDYSSGPLLVHCRDGIGRTGMFIALYDLVRQAEVNGRVDFFKTLIRLRQDRMNMIHNSDQYIFLHHAAYLGTVCLSVVKKGSMTLEQEFKHVSDLCNFFYEKEKSHNDIAEETYIEMEDYHSVVSKDCSILHNFKNQAWKILLPHPKSAADFWTIVVRHNVSLVIAFELDDLYCDEIVAKYLPSSTQDLLQCSPFDVKCTNISSDPDWDEHTIIISNTEDKNVQDKTVRHFQCNFVDFNTRKMLAVLQHSSTTGTYSDATLFMCRNGKKYCGLACVASLMLSSLAQKSFVSIPLLLTSVKSLNPELISTCEEYKLLHQVLQECHQMSLPGHEYDIPESKIDETNTYARCDDMNVYDVIQYT